MVPYRSAGNVGGDLKPSTVALVFGLSFIVASSGIASETGVVSGSQPWLWSRVNSTGLSPLGRQGQSVATLGQRLYVFGGCQMEIRCYNDLHILDTEELQWLQVPLSGEPPEPRGGHSATLVGSDIFVYGGASSEETFQSVYRLDPVKRRWSRIAATGPGGDSGPGRRTGHAAAADGRGRIFVFGGYDDAGNFLNDLWVLNPLQSGAAPRATSFLGDAGTATASWSRQVPSGPTPSAREGHSLTHIDGRLVVFGGYTAGGTTTNDAHIYDPEVQSWERLDIGGTLPPPRQAHSATRHGHAIIVAGGCDVSSAYPVCYNDVWSLSLIDMVWTQVSFDVVTWIPREGHSAAFVRGRMFTFGGCDLGSLCYNDVAALDSHDPCPATCGHHGVCVGGEFCKCSAPGFTGHDCLEPLVCPMDCGPHGACTQGGQCACDNGWTGPGCATELLCPVGALALNPHVAASQTKCSGRGVCLTDGRCQCEPGYTGLGCEHVAASLLSSCPLYCSGHGHCRTQDLGKSMCECFPGFTGDDCSEQVQQQTKVAFITQATAQRARRRATKHKVDNRDFGVQKVNEKGTTGSTSECKDFCNFQGICEEGICFCRSGFHGSSCSHEFQPTEGTLSPWVTFIIMGGVFLFAILFGFVVSWKNHTDKRRLEAESGYALSS
eukprot:TRINITY_DN67847_c0_g1_i1.p1 TRINITY_DN67847_c0_g1~~TRINITY_DN67847_c0_g1_i1.p1  ORF type:complete len:663 (-),score=90.28 TRINITY_DN67847_c0_g1_i1:117-2105(-)